MSLKSDSEPLIESILSKTWDELEAVEHDDALHFPEELVRKRADGKWERIPVLLKVPREPEMRKARIKARNWAKEEGLDPELDSEYFDNMDSLCVLSVALRSTTPPHEPFEPFPETLEKRYDRPCLDALWAKLEQYRKVIDPRPDELDEMQTLGLIAAIAEARNLVPLVAFAGDLQTSFVVSMAERHQSLLESKSSSEPSEPSTPEP